MLIPFDTKPRLAVAIPARNEADRLEACLRALDSQRDDGCDHIVLVLNNRNDDSAVLVRRLRLRFGVPITIVERHFAPAQANAGHARSHAMALAAQLVGPAGIIATTDADGIVGPGWIAANRAALANGAEVVCGRALIDPVEALSVSPALHADDAREVAYATMLDEIHGLVDPDPADPLPRHGEHSGASIAVTVAAWRRAGGVPPLPTGEDRGFLRALRLVDARVRHAPEVQVTVSGRLQGRAAGGMADTMARRMVCQDAFLDDALEPALICLQRARLRAAARAAWLRHDAMLRTRYFGQAWAQIEATTASLAHIPVARRALASQTAVARDILAGLRRAPCETAGPPGMMPGAEVHPR